MRAAARRGQAAGQLPAAQLRPAGLCLCLLRREDPAFPSQLGPCPCGRPPCCDPAPPPASASVSNLDGHREHREVSLRDGLAEGGHTHHAHTRARTRLSLFRSCVTGEASWYATAHPLLSPQDTQQRPRVGLLFFLFFLSSFLHFAFLRQNSQSVELPGGKFTGGVDAVSRQPPRRVCMIIVCTVQNILSKLVLTKKEVIKLTSVCVRIIKLLSPL